MTGSKTLAEVRAELEAALGTGPTGQGVVEEALRRFLAGQTDSPSTPAPQPQPRAGTARPQLTRRGGTAKRGR